MQDGEMDDLYIELIASAIWFVGGILVTLAWSLYHRRRRDAIFLLTGLRLRFRGRVHLIFGIIDDDRKPGHRYVQEGDVAALASAILFLERVLGANRVVVANARSAAPIEGGLDEIFSISGPIYNPVSGDLIEQAALRARFSSGTDSSGNSDDTLVVDIDDQGLKAEYFPVYQRGIPRECYGIVLSGSRPIAGQARTQRYTVVGGITTLGTFGCLHWLNSIRGKSWNEVFATEYDERQGMGVVIKVKDSSPEGFFSFASLSTAPSFIRTEIVHELPGPTRPKMSRTSFVRGFAAQLVSDIAVANR
jgi:hypothetical protein